MGEGSKSKRTDPRIGRHQAAAICASSVLAIGVAFMAHETAHVLAGLLAGGAPSLLTATEVKGDFDSLSPVGLVALGASGSVANLLLCLLGWWGLAGTGGQEGTRSIELRLAAWFFFAVNGMLVATKMTFETMIGWGDWMTILRPLPWISLTRAGFAMVGVAAMVFMVRCSGARLSGLIPDGEARERVREARRVVGIGAAAAAVLVLGVALAHPVGSLRGAWLALGAGLVPFVPLLFATRLVARAGVPSRSTAATGRWPWLLAAALVTVAMWAVYGPGIQLS